MTGNQSGNETARNLVPENARSYVRLRSPMPGCRQDREGPVVACDRSINCTSSAASSAAASASRPGSIVTKRASTLCSASATASIPAGTVSQRSCAHKLSLHDSQLFDLVTLLQTFRQTVERPNIIRVLCTPLNSTAQSQIVATDLLSPAVMALLSQQSCKRMRG